MKTSIIFAVTALAIITAIQALAQVPPLINYQGKLTDTGGVPLNAQVDITFSLHDASSGGNLIWTEIHTNVSVNNGLFSVLLGNVTPMDPTNFPASAAITRWLEVEVNGETLAPRKEMVSVAYAIKAGDADTLDGKDSTELGIISTAQDPLIISNGTIFLHYDTNDFELRGQIGLIDRFVDAAGDTMTGDLIMSGTAKIQGTNIIDSQGIKDGTITDADISPTANISASKINEADPTVTNWVKNGVSWQELIDFGNMPTGFADNVDNVGITNWAELSGIPDDFSDGEISWDELVGNQPIFVEVDPQVGTNQDNYVPRWDADVLNEGVTGALVKGTIYDSGTTNIGIGTETPGTTLELSAGEGQGPLLLSTPSPDLYFETGSDNYNWRIAAAEDGVTNGLTIWAGTNTDDNALDDTYVPGLTILQNGYVGIGTDQPSQTLHIAFGGVMFADGTVQYTAYKIFTTNAPIFITNSTIFLNYYTNDFVVSNGMLVVKDKWVDEDGDEMTGDLLMIGAAKIQGTNIIDSLAISNYTIIDEDISPTAAITNTKIANTALVENTSFGGMVTGVWNNLTISNNTVTSDMITDGTIMNTDIAANAQIASSKIIEADPIYTSSPAATITTNDIKEWDTAYGWGNHATNMYVQTNSAWVSNWNETWSWGDHATNGYLTNEIDPQVDDDIGNNYVPRWDSSVVHDAERGTPNGQLVQGDIFNDPVTHNIGIGTTSPGNYKVNIRGDATTAGLRVRSSVSPERTMLVEDNAGATLFEIYSDKASFPNGNVGIGTTSPQADLHISKGAGTDLILESDTSGAASYLKFSADAGPQTKAQIAGSKYGADGGVLTFSTMQSGTGTLTDRMVINSGGYVGIGTATPGTKLEVSGGNAKVAGPGQFIGEVGGTAWNLGSFGNPVGTLYGFSKPGVCHLVIDVNSGNVGIGTTTPGNKLDVNGGVVVSPNTAGKNTFELSTHASDEGRLRIKNGDTTTVQIRAGGDTYFNGGNVGIGKTPDAGIALDVNGAIQLSAPDYRIQAKPIGSSIPVLGFRGVGWHAGYTVLVPSYSGFRVVNWLNDKCNLRVEDFYGHLFVRGGIFPNSSDSRIKLNQRAISKYGLREVLALQVKEFDRADWTIDPETGEIEIHEENTTKDFGLVAQEVYEVVPEAVSKPEDETRELWGVDSNKLTPVLIKGIQELYDIIQELQKNNDSLEKRIETLEKYIGGTE